MGRLLQIITTKPLTLLLSFYPRRILHLLLKVLNEVDAVDLSFAINSVVAVKRLGEPVLAKSLKFIDLLA